MLAGARVHNQQVNSMITLYDTVAFACMHLSSDA